MKKQETPDVRLFVRITKRQRKMVTAIHNKEGISEAAVVREALDYYITRYLVK